MSVFGNTPSKANSVIHLEARKSFSLGIYLKLENGTPVDITGCDIRFVMKAQPYNYTDTTDASNLVVNSEAALIDAAAGYARLDLQASDLDEIPGEYDFTIVLITSENYSAVLAKGVIDLLPNTEFASMASTYTGSNPASVLDIALRGTTVLDIRAGAAVPPNMHFVSSSDLTLLEQLALSGLLGATPPLVPPGGFTNQVLAKLSNDPFDVGWVSGGTGGGSGGPDATGVPLGYLLTANGVDNYTWAAPPDTQVPADWTAVSGPTRVLNKPTLGTAAAQNVEAFAGAAHTHGLLDLSNVTLGTELPSGGTPGTFYLRVPAV